MRILLCNYEYPPLGGGGGVVNAMLAEELAKRHHVTVLTSRAFGLPAQEEKDGVRIIRVPVFFRRQQAAANFLSMLAYLPMGIRAGRRILNAGRFDIINTHFVLPSGPVGDALARRFRIPNVLSVHGGDLYDPSKWSSPHRHAPLRTWIRRLLRRADRVVGQSRNTLDNLHRYYAPEIQSVRIPLGIKRPRSGTASREVYGFTDDDVLFVTVGRLVARKAVDQLIEMLRGEIVTSVHLLVIGTGPLEAELRAQISRLGLQARVHLLGGVPEDEKFAVLRMADVFVSTSQHEGFGLVFLEAMACELPVVCYDHGGQTDFLGDGETGYLVTLNDLATFRSRCHALALDPQRRGEMGNESLRRVEELFIERCAERYEKLFEQVLGQGGV